MVQFVVFGDLGVQEV